MRFMNTDSIDQARERWRDHPVLGPAARTLSELRDAADASSDGWAFWPKPARAAAKLMELIEGDGTYAYMVGEREDATPEKLQAALRPIRAFRTRYALPFRIEDAVTMTTFAYINITTDDGTLVGRIECSAEDYDCEMRLPISICREISDAMMRAYRLTRDKETP